MRFLLALCLALFSSTFAFGQAALSIESIPLRIKPADVPVAAKSGKDDGRTQVPHPETPAPMTLVDAPTQTAQSSCTKSNGKPCREWVHKATGQYPPIYAREEWNGKPNHFFTFGDGRRALHPDKKSWVVFAGVHGGMWISAARAARNYPASKQPAYSAYPAAAAITGMDLLGFKAVSPALSVAPAVYAMIAYSRAASK